MSFDRDKMWDEILSMSDLVPVVDEFEQDEFTVDEYAERIGRSPVTARVHLVRLVSEGRFERREVVLDGHTMFAYRKVEDDNTTALG